MRGQQKQKPHEKTRLTQAYADLYASRIIPRVKLVLAVAIIAGNLVWLPLSKHPPHDPILYAFVFCGILFFMLHCVDRRSPFDD